MTAVILVGGGEYDRFNSTGAGTFGGASTVALGTDYRDVAVADLNNNARNEFIIADYGANKIIVGNDLSRTLNTAAQPIALSLADFNSDGALDIAVAEYGAQGVGVFLNDGSGQFAAERRFATGANPTSVTSADFDGDGNVDLATADANGISVLFGCGNGDFQAARSISTSGTADAAAAGDMNSDGYADLVTTGGQLFLSSDGWFSTAASTAAPTTAEDIALADLNGDSVTDIGLTGSAGPAANTVSLQNSTKVTSIARLNLSTQQGALASMETIDATLERATRELGHLGSYQSRFSVALNNLAVARENFLSAKSEISDADIAQESASLVKSKILQQVSSAILAQANRGPEVALTFL